MRAALLIARVELRRRLRNRSAIFTAFVGPLVMASVFGILLGDTASLSLRIGVVDLDGTAMTQPFTSGLLDRSSSGEGNAGPVEFVAASSRESATRAVDDGDLDAAIVVPVGFAAAVSTGQQAAITVLRDPGKQISGGVAVSIAEQYAASLGSRSLAVATLVSLGQPRPTAAELATMSDTVLTAVTEQGPGGHEVDAASFYGASMSILFLFFTVAFASRSLITERKNGLIPRILAASTAPTSIVVGKVLAVSVLGLAGFVTVWAVTSVGFGSSWGDPLAIVVTMVATVLAVGGVATFVCGLARTEEQADGYTSAVAFALALLGGNFLGPGRGPEGLRRAAAFTPNGQALTAFTKISVDGSSVGDVGRQVLLLFVFAVVFGVAGHVLINRSSAR